MITAGDSILGWLPRAGWRVVAVNGFAVWADDLAGAVEMDDEFLAQFVQQHMVVPGAVTLEVGQAGGTAVGPMDHMVGFTRRGGPVAAPRDPVALAAAIGQILTDPAAAARMSAAHGALRPPAPGPTWPARCSRSTGT